MVPFFNSFDSIYEANGWFHSTFTPPLAVGVFLGIFWKRFTTAGIIATFVGGAFLMVLGQFYPQLISPFAHGIELRPDRGYSYIGALYNIIVCAGVGIIVSLFTKSSYFDVSSSAIKFTEPSFSLSLFLHSFYHQFSLLYCQLEKCHMFGI